jgi:two-component sensor histidine kinase
MKRLLYLIVVVFTFKVSAQTFPVRNVNDEYVVTSLKGSEKYKNNIKELIRDKNGLYWFHNFSEVSSFDGVNWKKYSFANAEGRDVPVRINELEVTDDGMIWLATAEGLYGFDPRSEKFVPIKQLIPQLGEMPAITNCIYKGIGNFLLYSAIKQGFYIFNWTNKELKYVVIDSVSETNLPASGIDLFVTIDRSGNYWGLPKDNKGIWFYSPATGEIRRSWKGEIFPNGEEQLQKKQITGIKYSPKDDALLLVYGQEGILEKKYLSTGKNIFYTFSDNLNVRADTNTKHKYPIQRTTIDPEGNEWVLVAEKYLVKLDPEINKCEYIVHDADLLPVGETVQIPPKTNMLKNVNDNDENLLWISGNKGLSVLKKRNAVVKQVRFDEESIDGITPKDYVNRDAKEKIPYVSLFFVKSIDDSYLLLQQNEGRPKLLRFDKNFHITHVLLNKEWKDYPAYFNPRIGSDDFYVAIMRLRPKDEPLDFRNVVVKDFKIDLRSMKAEEVNLNFSQRVWRYGVPDATNTFWLFSNGYLYSYDPKNNLLDSIFICAPRSKQGYFNRVKKYDFPTVLHKNSSTFWISFVADKELYKIDLEKRKIDKIFKSDLEQKGCLTGSVLQLHNFDSSRIYLKLNFSTALVNPYNDSITYYSDLFINKLPYEDAIGSLVYKNWLCSVTTTEINFQNTVTGKQKRISLDQDFKWALSALNFPPPVNEEGEMILMSSAQRGFILFNIDSVLDPPTPGIVHFSFIKLNEKELQQDSLGKSGSLRLKYNQYSSIHFRFSDYSLFNQAGIKYEYTLYNGGDTVWNKIEGAPELTFTKITPGKYRLLIRAGNGFGDYSPEVTAFSISIIPPFTQTIWFLILLVVLIATLLYGIYRYRLQQIKRLQVIRNNIASDLHDDIGSTLNSISIYSEVAKQQAGREVPALDLIGANSRKIIESMSDIVWTINPENDSFEKIIVRMRSFAHQLLKAKKMEYTFEVDEKLSSVTLPMQVRKNFYLVFKEAITNLIKYSGASRVSISLKEENRTIVLIIRDNGIGIPVNPETQGNGLINMQRRAEEIHAHLNIISGNGEGTGVELVLKTKDIFVP